MELLMTHRETLDLIGALAEKAEFDGSPAEAVQYASEATRAAFRPEGGYVRVRSRVTAYFNTVLTRRIMRRWSRTDAAARVVAESVVADLLGTGRTPKAAYQELEQGWAASLPQNVLQEYRERLCA